MKKIYFLFIAIILASCKYEKTEFFEAEVYLLGDWDVLIERTRIVNGISSYSNQEYEISFFENNILFQIDSAFNSDQGVVEQWTYGRWWIDGEKDQLIFSINFSSVDPQSSFEENSSEFTRYEKISIIPIHRNKFESEEVHYWIGEDSIVEVLYQYEFTRI